MSEEDRPFVEIDRSTLQAIFDLAVNSMDAGSGFWDHEEADSARAVAVALGLDPMKGTPHNLAKSYKHEFVARPHPGTYRHETCRWCGDREDHATHQPEAATS